MILSDIIITNKTCLIQILFLKLMTRCTRAEESPWLNTSPVYQFVILAWYLANSRDAVYYLWILNNRYAINDSPSLNYQGNKVDKEMTLVSNYKIQVDQFCTYNINTFVWSEVPQYVITFNFPNSPLIIHAYIRLWIYIIQDVQDFWGNRSVQCNKMKILLAYWSYQRTAAVAITYRHTQL